MPHQDVFRAISDPTRRQIIDLLASNELNVNQIANNFDMTRPAIAKHLGILNRGGLVEVTAQGRERIHKLRPEALKTVSDWLSYYSHFWDEKLVNLKQAVEAEYD